MIGAVVGGAAESGKLQKLTSTTAGKGKPIANGKAAVKRIASKPRRAVKAAMPRKARAVRPKSKSRSRS